MRPDILHIAAKEGQTLQVLTDRVTIKLGGDQTRGAYFLAEDQVPPARSDDAGNLLYPHGRVRVHLAVAR